MDTNKWPPQESCGVYNVKPMMEQLMNPNNSNSNMMSGNSSASISCPNSNTHSLIKAPTLERRGMKPPPQNKDQALHCPRCNSANTKFCYYNNYSLTQPRYFCKTCRRYWTEGGSLRNVPVGGGSRKNKRPITANNTTTANHQLLSSSPSSTLSFLKIPPAADNSIPPPSSISSLHDSHNSQNPRAGQDLNLTYLGLSQFVHHHGANKNSINDHQNSSSNNNSTTTSSGAALELLRTGIASRGLGLGSYMPAVVPAVPTPVSDSGDNNTSNSSNGGIYSFHHQEYLRPPTLSFGVDHGVGSNNRFIGGVHLHHHHHQESGGGGIGEGRMLFPFGEAKQQISGGNGASGGLELDHSTVHQGNNNHSSGWWNTSSSSTSHGMLGGGGSW